MLVSHYNINEFWENKDEFISEGSTLLIDKDLTWTSNDVVSKLRGMLRTKKVGHAGTLDPFATGLLIVCIGKDTKKINQFADAHKTYYATARLGAVTKSFDAEHPELNQKNIDHITSENIKSVVNTMQGKQLQVPPIYSAKKLNGQRHYELSRKNIKVVPNSCEIDIDDIQLHDYYKPFFEFSIKCSKGTYIRSVANDIGAKLDLGAYLFKLRRTAIGDLSVDNAFKIDSFNNFIKRT